MSTFSGLTRAYSGLAAARAGLDTVGQNITNQNTVGYTRQRVQTSAIGSAFSTRLDGSVRFGGGVSVDGVSRLDNSLLDSRVRSASANQSYWQVRSTVMSNLEGVMQEPGNDGLSAGLNQLWSAWQDVANHAGQPAQAGVLLEKAQLVAGKIAQGYANAESEWSRVRSDVTADVADVNRTATEVAQLNDQIRQTLASGGSANELLDKRSMLTTQLAAQAGAVVRDRGDGMIDVTVGGSALVSGATARSLTVVGAGTMSGVATAAVSVEWSDRPGSALDIDGGSIAGTLGMLASASSGGAIAQAAESYNDVAQKLAAAVNAIHSTGTTPDGTTGHDFFSFQAGVAAARGLTIVPTSVAQIAAGAPGAGGVDGSIAAKISQLGTADDGPNAVWSAFVVSSGVAARTATNQSTLADRALTGAFSAQQAESSVDYDEETLAMLTYQHAYQGAARMMTAVDEMLETIINRMGLVGR